MKVYIVIEEGRGIGALPLAVYKSREKAVKYCDGNCHLQIEELVLDDENSDISA